MKNKEIVSMPKQLGIASYFPGNISYGLLLLLLYVSGPSDTNLLSAWLDPASEITLKHQD